MRDFGADGDDDVRPVDFAMRELAHETILVPGTERAKAWVAGHLEC